MCTGLCCSQDYAADSNVDKIPGLEPASYQKQSGSCRLRVAIVQHLRELTDSMTNARTVLTVFLNP
jgi:hypothetical protein